MKLPGRERTPSGGDKNAAVASLWCRRVGTGLFACGAAEERRGLSRRLVLEAGQILHCGSGTRTEGD